MEGGGNSTSKKERERELEIEIERISLHRRKSYDINTVVDMKSPS